MAEQVDTQALYARLNTLLSKSAVQPLSGQELKELRQINKDLAAIKTPEEIAKSKEMRNRRRRGKYNERRVARLVGGRADGRVGKKDVVQGMFSYETKSWQALPASVIKLMDQAARLAKSGTIPVGVMYCSSPKRAFYIVEEQDWVDLHGAKRNKEKEQSLPKP